jgi:hypothetical protein
MEETEMPVPATSPNKEKMEVYTIRDWKEYLGESLLIIFSVLLALIVTEYLNRLHENENTKETIKSLVAELKHNKIALQEIKDYNGSVMRRTDSALANTTIETAIVNNDEFHLNKLAPAGVIFRYLDNAAWTVAKANNISAKLDIETVALLTKVYQDQEKVLRVEDEIGKLILSRESRNPVQTHATLILFRDIYHGWAIDRTDGLLQQINLAIGKLATP